MIRPRALTSLALSVLLFEGAVRPLAAQGFGGSFAAGAYRSGSLFNAKTGLGVELSGRWTFPAGIAAGLGARLIHSSSESRLSGFIDVRYAPAPSPSRRVQPIIGARAGPYIAGLEDAESPVIGLEGGPVLGIAIRAAKGVSLTMAGEIGLILDSNHYYGERRFIPGLQVGITLH